VAPSVRTTTTTTAATTTTATATTTTGLRYTREQVPVHGQRRLDVGQAGSVVAAAAAAVVRPLAVGSAQGLRLPLLPRLVSTVRVRVRRSLNREARSARARLALRPSRWLPPRIHAVIVVVIVVDDATTCTGSLCRAAATGTIAGAPARSWARCLFRVVVIIIIQVVSWLPSARTTRLRTPAVGATLPATVAVVVVVVIVVASSLRLLRLSLWWRWRLLRAVVVVVARTLVSTLRRLLLLVIVIVVVIVICLRPLTRPPSPLVAIIIVIVVIALALALATSAYTGGDSG
jgi:hypothetical protein